MKWSQSHLFTLKDSPADAEIPSHKLMIRSGFIRKLAPGIYTYGPLALRSIRKFEAIVREEMNNANGVEILMPMVHPKEIWDESGRWAAMGSELLRFKNRNDHEFCLGGTHEEVITDYVRKDIKSYKHLPVILFQIQTKFRDEIRPRFGLMRGREFIMKDAYSFDVDKDSANKSYDRMFNAYTAIFSRLDLEIRVVQADSGNIGGDQSQEFHVIAEQGEDELLIAEKGDFAANIEVCPAPNDGVDQSQASELKLEKFPTPKLRTIEDLSKATQIEPALLVKTMFFALESGPIAVLLRGSDEVNPIKVKNLLNLDNPPLLLSDKEVKTLTGASPGSCGPVGLKIPIYCDVTLEKYKNFIVGANEDDFHLKNVNFDSDFKVIQFADLRMAKAGDKTPDGKSLLQSKRGIEVGHIFYLGTKYSEAMSAGYLDKNGKLKPIEMGCYGIGIGRTVQAAIEQCYDADGMVWPKSISPFQVHICLLDPKDEKVSGVAFEIYHQLISQGIDCLIDDRDERPGVKFKDADLFGFPIRLTIGGRGIKDGIIEVVERKSKDQQKIPVDQVASKVIEWFKN